MFFSDHGNDSVLTNMNGKLYPHPPLLFKACGIHLWIRALAKEERPTAETKLCMAPYDLRNPDTRAASERNIPAVPLFGGGAGRIPCRLRRGASAARRPYERGDARKDLSRSKSPASEAPRKMASSTRCYMSLSGAWRR